MFVATPSFRRSDPGSLAWRRCRSLVLGAAAAVLVLAAPARWAQAQITLVAVQDETNRLGPHRAQGAIIWSHGRAVDVEDSLAPTPNYVQATRTAGWDIFRLNRMRASDTLPASGAALAREADRLKTAGYRRVVLAGQSFGGFISLIAAGQSDAIDAVIATAPAAFGSFQDSYDTFRLNATKLYELLSRVRRARVALVFFHGDIFDPGGRGERSEAILAARGLPRLVIDQPPRLVSHWASSGPEFADRFAGCLTAFAENDVARGALNCETITGGRHQVAEIR